MIMYTDGSGYYKDGSAGFGVVYVKEEAPFKYCMFGHLPLGTTVQQAELLAVLYGLQHANVKEPILVVSDSKYVVDSMNNYALDWLNRALSWYGVTTFANDTVLELYRMLRETIGPEAPLDLENSSQEPIANQPEWERLWRYLLDHRLDVTFEWTAGHSDERYNDIADFLASQGRDLAYEVHDIERFDNRKDRRIR